MKKDLMEILACPLCKWPLELCVAADDNNEIIRGTLTCVQCSQHYPIEDGIPNLLPLALRN